MLGTVVVLPAAHLPEAQLLIEGDGGGVARPHLQGEEGQVLPAVLYVCVQQGLRDALAAVSGATAMRSRVPSSRITRTSA